MIKLKFFATNTNQCSIIEYRTNRKGVANKGEGYVVEIIGGSRGSINVSFQKAPTKELFGGNRGDKKRFLHATEKSVILQTS